MTWLGLVPGLLDSASRKGNEGSRAGGGGGGGGGGGCEENPDKKCAKQIRSCGKILHADYNKISLYLQLSKVRWQRCTSIGNLTRFI